MTELETYIANYPGGTERLARDLISLAPGFEVFEAFNMLWKAPDHIAPTCNFFGLATVAQVLAFAQSLQDGTGWVTYRAKLSEWINPRPGVFLSDLQAVLWADLVPVLTGGQVPALDPYWVQPNDGTFRLTTVAQAATIMANCPARRYPYKSNDNDCDDRVRVLRGWLSEHGLGSVAIGMGGYQAFMGDSHLGGHALGLAICTDRKPYLAEPADGKVYPISKTNLGGFTFATRIAFTLAQF